MKSSRFWLAVFMGMCVTLGTASPASAQQTGRLVFVGTYTNEKSHGIFSFRFNDETGTLTPLGLAIETPSPSFVIASADGRYLFAVNEVANYRGETSGSVSSFAIDRGTGKLTWLSTQSSKGTSPCHLALDRTGRFLAVANYSSGTLAVLPVGADGKIAPAVQVIAHQGKGPDASRQEGPHAHQVVFSDDNRYLIAVDLGIDRVLVYRFNQATAGLTPNTPTGVSVAPGSGPRHLAFHPDGKRAFVISELASTITTMNWDAAGGTFTPGASVRTLPAGFQGASSTAEIVVHLNGKFVYGSNRGHDSIAAFSIGATGALTPVGFEPTRGKTPRHFAIAPGGRWLLAANQDSGTLAVYRIDEATGKLTPSGALVEAGTPVCVLFQ
ncbi:MAG: lactonase family protein [Acidobacteriota bacterium]